MAATGALGFQCQVSLSSSDYCLKCSHGILTLSGSSTCIQQSATEIRNEDCQQFNKFFCELNVNAVFDEPPEGKVWFAL